MLQKHTERKCLVNNAQQKNYIETILNDEKLTQQEKIQRINYIYNNYRQKLDKDLRNYLVKKWAGAALEIGSAAIPFGGAGKLGATAGQKLLQKTIGRKLSQEIGAGATSGLVSGGVFGTGRGMIEDKNPLMTGLQDAASGLAAGGLIGGAGGYLEKAVRANLLENAKPLNELSQAQIKNLVKRGKDYYQDYLRDTYVSYPLLDKIYFHNSQAGEIRPHNMKMIPRLPEQIRDAQGLRYSNDKPWRDDANNFYKLYNTYKGKTYEYVIRNKANKTGNDFYQIKEVDPSSAYLHHNQALELEPNNIINDISRNINHAQADGFENLQKLNKSAAKRLTVSAPTSNLSLEKGDNSISRLAADKTIINDNSKKVNPVPMIIPPQLLQNLQNGNQPSFLLEGSVEMNVDQNGNQIFTPQQIGNMASDEFEKNLKTIEQQLKNGLIKPQKQEVDYFGYLNPATGDGKIFSREAISQMSGEEYTANESAIMSQLKSIGIPYEAELEEASKSRGGLVYVSPYTRSDGTEVSGYWRSRPSY